MDPAEQRFPGLRVQQVELELVTHHDVEAEFGRVVENLLQHAARRGRDRLFRRPAGVADHLGRPLEPGHEPDGGGVGHELLVAVVDLLVQSAAADHAGGAVQADDAAVEVQASARVALDLVDRHDLGAARAVQVRQLEAQVADVPGSQLFDHRGDGIRCGHVFASLGNVRPGRRRRAAAAVKSSVAAAVPETPNMPSDESDRPGQAPAGPTTGQGRRQEQGEEIGCWHHRGA